MMLIEYLPLAIIFFVSLFVAGAAIALGHFFGPRRPSKIKGMPYESGMVPYGPGARRMNVRYYLVAVLFILFDIELVFFLPWAVVFRKLGLYGVVEMFIFVAVLMAGYVYAWKKGALEWD